MRLPVREIRPDLVNRIGRIRNEHVVAGVHERQGDMGDALFRANQGDHLGSRIERNPEPRPIPVRDGLTIRRHAIIGGILVIRGFSRSRVEFFDDVGGGRQIRIAYTQTDDVHSRIGDFLLHPVDFREEIGRQALQAIRAFDID